MTESNAAGSGESLAERANDLYWNSELTVDEVVESLDMSRGALYSVIRPIPAGVTCGICGERMEFTNRSSRSSGTATCPACAAEQDLSAEPAAVGATAGADDSTEELDGGYDRSNGARSWERWRRDLSAVAPERAAFIGGAAALGVVVGAVAARAVRG